MNILHFCRDSRCVVFYIILHFITMLYGTMKVFMTPRSRFTFRLMQMDNIIDLKQQLRKYINDINCE